jgi:hypothetical protein
MADRIALTARPRRSEGLMIRAAIIGISAIVVGCAGQVPSPPPSSSSATAVAAGSLPPASVQPSASPVSKPTAESVSPPASPSPEMAVAAAYLAALEAGNVQAAAALIGPGAKARTSAAAPYQTLADAAAALAFVQTTPPCVLKVTDMRQTGSVVFVHADIDAASSSACPVAPGTGIEVQLTIVNGVITVIG